MLARRQMRRVRQIVSNVERHPWTAHQNLDTVRLSLASSGMKFILQHAALLCSFRHIE